MYPRVQVLPHRFPITVLPKQARPVQLTTTRIYGSVGYTPYYTAGIWFGYDDSTLMRYRLGRNYNAHKVLWKNIMNEVLEGYEDRDFVMPSDVEKIRVCSSTGLLASYGCNAITEYFAKDTGADGILFEA